MNAMSSQARLRQLERHGAASLRALSGVVNAEYRASRIRVGGNPAPFAAPYLSLDFSEADLSRSRGVIDALGMRLRHSDRQLHRSMSPPRGFARLVFDVCEQTRCESLIDPAFKGIKDNMDQAFMQWCQEAHGSGFCDSDLGILLYSVIHMLRARLIGTFEDETAEALIEATRANLGPIIGKSLYRLKALKHDQRAFAEPAIQISEALEQLVINANDDIEDSRTLSDRHSIVLPPGWNDDGVDGELESEGIGVGLDASISEASAEQLERIGDYRVFTKEFDVEVRSVDLFDANKRLQLRQQLDKLVLAQAVSVPRLARELQLLLATPQRDGWLFGQDEGMVDARRLGQIVSNPENRHIFVQDRQQLKSDAVVSFLIDNSGSMKRQRFEAVAVLVDTYCRALGLAGIHSEVLGFTTADWNGGKAMKQWRSIGQPENPGRIGESMHIVYKTADSRWRRSRSAVACLLDTKHFREGIDGEALIWAYQRLRKRSEANRYLVVISDGAPMDSATHNTNRDGFLIDHLASVARVIDKDPQIRMGAIGIDLDLSTTFARSANLDLGGTLGQASYRVLHHLFGAAHDS